MTEQPRSSADRTDPSSEAPVAETRRGILSRGAKLALAAPAVIAALQAGPAFADSGPDHDDEGPGHGKGHGHRPDHRSQAVPLCRVSEVGNNDFAAASPETDPLRSGHVRVFPTVDQQSLRVQVSLRGAQPNTQYQVLFARFSDHTREPLGSITTRPNGNAQGFIGNLSGARRVGVFVITNGTRDEFVSCLHG